ncbi:unnamed protein product [Owenia fusiformis]|uniref:Uncharacterized protein n=1 Tax=Owenia fusiformis TaxID=6347 RepID=A0A8J1TBR8_OWEFU|nr:unnamed protein product [Owenia fusiformis]
MGCYSPLGGIEWGIIPNFSITLQFITRCIFMNDWATLTSKNATTGLLAREQRMGIYYMCDQIGEGERVCQSTINMAFPHSYKAAGALAIVSCILLVLCFVAFMVGLYSMRKCPDIFSGKYFAVVAIFMWISTLCHILSYTIFGTYIETNYYHVRPFYDSTLTLGGWYQMMGGSGNSLVVAALLTVAAGMVSRRQRENMCSNGQTNPAVEMEKQ